MELLRVGIKDIICLRRLTSGRWLLLFRLWGRCGSYRSRLLLLLLSTICQLALACGIVNLNARLDIVGKDAVGNPGTLVFHRIAFHQNAVGQKIISLKNRRYTVHDMVAVFLHIVRNHIFEWQHALNVQVSGAGNQVLCIGVFAGQLKANEVATVVEILSIDQIIIMNGESPFMMRINYLRC